MKKIRSMGLCTIIVFLIFATCSCEHFKQQSVAKFNQGNKVKRLEELVSNPPPDMNAEEVANEIASFFPRMKRNKSMAQYEEVHKYASVALPQALEMEKHFEAVDHFITHYGMNTSETVIWNSVAFFGDRYELAMQIEIKINYSERIFFVLGKPTFYLTESIRVDRDGGCLSGESFVFGESEFEELVDANWDFSAIGIKINSQPVLNFKIYEAMVRSPRYPISLAK